MLLKKKQCCMSFINTYSYLCKYTIYMSFIFICTVVFLENKSRKRLLRQTNSVIGKRGMHETAMSLKHKCQTDSFPSEF